MVVSNSWRKTRDWVIKNVHDEIPEIKKFVEENFNLKKQIVRNSVALTYIKSAVLYRDYIIKGIVPNPGSLIKEIDDYGFSFYPNYPEPLAEYFNEFRLKAEGKIFEKFIQLSFEYQGRIRDAIIELKLLMYE